jgi:hypothetical protein
VLSGGPSSDTGFSSRSSPVTSLVEGGMTCWSSSGTHGAAGRGRVGSSSKNEVDGQGAEAVRDRARR